MSYESEIQKKKEQALAQAAISMDIVISCNEKLGQDDREAHMNAVGSDLEAALSALWSARQQA